jgi:hypothetical protein
VHGIIKETAKGGKELEKNEKGKGKEAEKWVEGETILSSRARE